MMTVSPVPNPGTGYHLVMIARVRAAPRAALAPRAAIDQNHDFTQGIEGSEVDENHVHDIGSVGRRLTFA